MAFASGPVTFKRFFVAGSAPERVSQDLLDRVARRAIGNGSVAARDGSEAGWVTGDHILDTKFDFGKNAIAECLYLAMRVDANKPPSEIVRSYQKMHEQALLEKSGREFLSRQERREAREARADHMDDAAQNRPQRSTAPISFTLSTPTRMRGLAKPRFSSRASTSA